MLSSISNLNNNYSQNKEKFSFGRRHEYTKNQKELMKTLKKTALAQSLPDFYTGRIFCKQYPPTIEHIIPFHKQRKGSIDGLQSINGIENFVPVGTWVNNERLSIPLKKWYEIHPDYIVNGQQALREYEKIQEVGINGKSWVQSLKKTLNSQLGSPVFTGNKNK